MGILRTFLALCVVGAHTEPIFRLSANGGTLAVQCFYVISGFYMALVLTEKYSSALTFYKARLLRLLPMYWTALLITVALGFAFHQWDVREAYARLPVGVALLTTFSNLLLLGQDWLYFIPGGYESTTIIGQAWTLGVELSFYAIAPFLIRLRTLPLVGVALLSFGARDVAADYGLAGPPLDYRFFPFELAYFVLGMLAYRFYAVAKPAPVLGLIAGACLLAMSSIFTQSFHYKYLALVVVAVSFLFSMTKNSRIDAAIGELSYPIYITHMIFVAFFSDVAKALPFGYGISIVVMSIAFSVFLILLEKIIRRILQQSRCQHRLLPLLPTRLRSIFLRLHHRRRRLLLSRSN